MKIIIVPVLIVLMCFVLSCNDPEEVNKKPVSGVVSKNIPQPRAQAPQKKDKPSEQKIKKSVVNDIKDGKKSKTAGSDPDQKSDQKPGQDENAVKVADHYESKGKTDPFVPLLQEKVEVVTPTPDDEPERIKTPLEKIELSQIRLVAVIVMKNRRIAMVEEASGKGYEVGLGTYIGKRNGTITQIKDSSIVVKELVRDFKGRLSERVQEIKLQKNDTEE